MVVSCSLASFTRDSLSPSKCSVVNAASAEGETGAGKSKAVVTVNDPSPLSVARRAPDDALSVNVVSNAASTASRSTKLPPKCAIKVLPVKSEVLIGIPITDRNSNTWRWPGLASASVIMGRIAANVKHLGQIFLASEPIPW